MHWITGFLCVIWGRIKLAQDLRAEKIVRYYQHGD